MSRWLFVLFVVLTLPDGSPVYISPQQVISVYPAPGGFCSRRVPTVVQMVTGQFCVQENPSDAVAKLSGDTK